jgi:hypothetical protein
MRRRSGTAACLIALSVVVTSGSTRGEKARSTVAIVRTSSGDRLLREASMRLRAELSDAGFAVVEVERSPGDSRAEVEDAAPGGSNFATVAMNRSGTGALADVWISDHVTGKTVVRRLKVGESPNAAAVLAIRALELLRASLLEVAAKGNASSPPLSAPFDVLEWTLPALPTREPPPKDLFKGGTLGVGVLGLHGLRGVGLAVGPTLRVSHGITGRWFSRLTLAGPLVGPELSAPAGSATVRQEFASLDLGWASAPDPLGVFAWIGAGLFDLHTVGSAVAPYHQTSDSVLSFLSTAGVGGVARMGSRTAFVAEVAALALLPRPFVAIGGEDAGSAGAPSIAVSLGLLVGL